MRDCGNLVLMGDLNINVYKQNHTLVAVLEVTGTKHLVKGPTCFKNPAAPTTLDLVITNVQKRFNPVECIANGLSDVHAMVCFSAKLHVGLTKKIEYRSYKKRFNPVECIANGLSDVHAMVCFSAKLHVGLTKKIEYRSYKQTINTSMRTNSKMIGMLHRSRYAMCLAVYKIHIGRFKLCCKML